MPRTKKGPKSPKKDNERQVLTPKRLMAKARAMAGNAVDESAALSTIESTDKTFDELGAVEPPYDPESLLTYNELTPHVSPCLDSLSQNIEGHGYLLLPLEGWMANLDSDEATEAIRQAIEIERWVAAEEAALAESNAEKQDEDMEGEEPMDEPAPPGEGDDEVEDVVTDEEVEAAREEIRLQMTREAYLADAWFRNCCSEMSFVRLRRIVRHDIEAHGWGTIERKRDCYGRLKRLAYVPGYTVRPLKSEGEAVYVLEPDPVTPLSKDREIQVARRFRIYVQVVSGKKVYFKSPGDPRVVSRTTGKTYETIDDMRRPKDAEPPGEGKEAEPANELMWHALHDPRTPCPPPRWIGNLLAVLGVREADETTYFYLNGNAIPPAIMFVSGGRLLQDSKDRIESRMDAEFRGAENSHKILVIEAVPSGSKTHDRTMVPEIKFESLRDAQLSDATFTQYDERSSERIGASFRLPPILRGYTPRNLNRATAMASLTFAEEQVFQPARDDIDWMINKFILPEIGVKYHTFRSNSPPTRSVEDISELVKATAPQGGILPYEIRGLVGDALNTPLAKVDEDWAKVPMAMTLAGMGGGGSPAEMGEGGELTEAAKRLADLEARVAAIITEELRASGHEMDVRARFVDPANLEEDDDQ